jgi:two-component system cell cycle sensor histidine kinase/response regulator CckA
MKTFSLKKRTLIPLSLGMAVLLGAFVVSIYNCRQKHMTTQVESKLHAVQELFTGQLDSDAGMMAAALHMLRRDQGVKTALKAQDRKALFDLTSAEFGHLHVVHGLTHLYFTGPDRINILRVHKPDKYGDEIDRFTTLEAEKTGKLSYGIELGPLGTFTLRVVEPWYDGQAFIGYVELGEEIEHITRKLHNILGVEVYVFIDKAFLDRSGWESGMRMLGREAHWDRFPSVVMIDQTLDAFPESLAGFLAKEYPASKKTDLEVSLNDRHYRTRFIRMNDASGRAVGDMIVMTDVTDMVAGLRTSLFFIGAICLVVGGALFIVLYAFVGRTETEMRTANEELVRVTKAVSSTSDAIIIADPLGQPVYQNEASLELFGYALEELKAAGGSTILYADPAVAIELSNTIKKGNSWRGEVEARHRLGRKIPVLLCADAIVGKGGKVAGFISIHTDMRERKRAEEALRESEQRFKTLFDSAGDAIFIHDFEGKMIEVNQVACNRLGYTRSELLKMTPVDFNPPEEEPLIPKRLEELQQKGQIRFETTHVASDGRTIPVEVVSRTIDYRGNGVMISVARDISERKRAEREQHKLQTQLAQAQKMKAIGTLAGGVAHEFNNLLMGIQGNASLLLMDMDSQPSQHQRLRNIEAQIEIGAQLTSLLLGYARQGKYEVRLLDLNRLVEETFGVFGRTKKGIKVHLELTEGSLAVEADRRQLEQVFLNLFLNAVDAMPKGGDLLIKTMYTTHSSMKGKPYDPRPGNYAMLIVADTGTGMDEKTMERVFDPFFTTKEVGQGTGLGLASAYGIIKAHGGYIDVDSAKGHGSTFTIYLPVSEKAYKVAKIADKIIQGTETVLLVDDEPSIRQVGRDLLEAMGYRVLEAADGEEAIEAYRKNQHDIDIVLLEMTMHKMGGDKACVRLKEINPDVKVLLVGSSPINGEVREVLKPSCDGFIEKPFNMKTLSAKMREIFDRK